MKKILLILCLLLCLCTLCGCEDTGNRETARQILFGDELLGDRRDFLLRWESPLLLAFRDVPGEEQTDALAFLDEVSSCAPLLPAVTVVSDPALANVVVTYAPYSELKAIEGENFGLCRYAYEGKQLTGAEVWIASDTTTAAQRRHLIREELLHALGLTNDHSADESSLLYSGWTETAALSSLDREVLSFLYGDQAYSGMSVREFEKAYGKAVRKIDLTDVVK